MQDPAELLDGVAELFRDVPVLMNDLPEDLTLWCAGKRKTDMIKALQAGRPDLRPVLIGKDRDELFVERDALHGLPSMGFLRNLETPGWTTGLPYPVHAVSLAFRLSALNDSTRERCLKELFHHLVVGGCIVWTDFFLPQTLDLQALYLEEYARLAALEPNERSQFDESFMAHHPNPVLLETAISEVYQTGFANAEIVAKRMGIAVLVVRK